MITLYVQAAKSLGVITDVIYHKYQRLKGDMEILFSHAIRDSS